MLFSLQKVLFVFTYLCELVLANNTSNYNTMLTLNVILEEIKDVPVSRLEELHEFVRSLTPTTKPTDILREKILSYGGAFSDMSQEDYADFLSQTKETRAELFDRSTDI